MGKKHLQAGGALAAPLSELPMMKLLLARPPGAHAKAIGKPVKKTRQKASA